jgi:hypothetical protein
LRRVQHQRVNILQLERAEMVRPERVGVPVENVHLPNEIEVLISDSAVFRAGWSNVARLDNVHPAFEEVGVRLEDEEAQL